MKLKIGNKDLAKIMREVSKAGWTIERRANNHIKVIAPDGGFTFISATPSDIRAIPRIVRDLRKMGLNI
jgi:hypothetical protein